MKKRDCLDCKHYAWEHQNRFDEMYCSLKHRVINMEPGTGIPKWCPVRIAEKRERKVKNEKGKSGEGVPAKVSGVDPQGGRADKGD